MRNVVFARRLALLFLVVLFARPLHAQQQVVSLNINAGFDGRFRENHWTPLLVTITNNGDPIEGMLTARVERNQALTNTYSTPVSLATGARQSVFLYVTMQGFSSELLVELLNANGSIAAEETVAVRNLRPRDRLYAVVTSGANNAVQLDQMIDGGFESVQVNWFPNNIPDRAAALDALDLLVLTDVDTGTFTPAQREAINGWVIGGGHLVVTGGANWQATAAGVTDLLPLTPASSRRVDDVTSLATFAGDYSTNLSGDITAATGQLVEGATVLAAADDLPLLARHEVGGGVVDYLAVDPSLDPLREWEDQPALWFNLLSTVGTQPGWTYGLNRLGEGSRALEILPGYSALPEAMAMVGFLALYIVLIGPVNYLVLRRLNRRELAWITIPVCIIVFSALAWIVGFNLRGSEVVLSRLSFVQSWQNTDEAHAEQLIGLLAPRRATYTLATTDDRLMRPIIRNTSATSSLFQTATSDVEIVQTDTVAATDFAVDASFVAGFTLSGTTEKPAITGSATLTYSPDGAVALRGSVRNGTDFVLNDPVILGRGIVLPLEEGLQPGDQLPFSLDQLSADDTLPPAAAPIEYARGETQVTNNPTYYFGRTNPLSGPSETASNIIGQEVYDRQFYSNFYDFSEDATRNQELLRRQNFLNAFMIDQYNSTARGNQLYLAAWTDSAPFEEALPGASWRAVDTTLHLIELDYEIVRPPTNTLITADQFTWVAVDRDNVLDATPLNLNLYGNSEIIFRYTPLPDAVLSEVEELFVIFDEARSFQSEIDLQLWEWEAAEWADVRVQTGRTRIPDPIRFVGPQNAVQIRVRRDDVDPSFYISRLAVEQRGDLN